MNTLTEVLEWGLFEVFTIVLLVAIFLWMLMGDEVSHFRNFLKKRGNAAERLERKLDAATKRQQKLQLKKRTLRESAAVSVETGATVDAPGERNFFCSLTDEDNISG